MTWEEIVKLAGDVFGPVVHSNEATILTAYRYDGQPCASGTRVDLGCECCGHKIALSPKSVEFVESKKMRAVCRQCFSGATGHTFLPPGE